MKTDHRLFHGLLAALLLAIPAVQAQAQTLNQAGESQVEDGTEDMTDGATIVRGRYSGTEGKAEWEAAMQKGKPERIAEWRDYGDNGNANVVFTFHNGDLMHYGEHGQRRGGQAGSMDGFRKIELNLSFSNGRYTGGRKTIDGIETEPTEAEIRGANMQALAALERLASAKPAWQSTGQTTGFSMTSVPQPAAPSPEARKLAGEGGEIVFRCSDSLHALMGAAQDRLVVETAGRSPVTLQRQQPGSRYDYFGAGWGAERRGEDLRLQDASGQAQLCRIVSAGAPPASLPPSASPPPSLPRNDNAGAGSAPPGTGAPLNSAPLNSAPLEPLPTVNVPAAR